MTWTAPDVTRPVGALDTDEATMLRGLLDYHRVTLLHKCAGLTGEQLAARPIPQSTLSLHGLIRHMAKVERIWFRRRFSAEDIPMLYSTPEHKDADFDLTDPADAQADYERLLAEVAACREIVADAFLDATFVDDDGDKISLRFIHIHMIGEYQRHNGHADMLRQCLDGVTGA